MPAKANKIGFNSAACYAAIQKWAEGLMTGLAEKLKEVMTREIMSNGNGSPTHMRIPTVAQIKEVIHEVTDSHIRIGVGIDPAAIGALDERMRIIVGVVLYGNQGGGPIHTKPGQDTWKKYVSARGPSGADSVYSLPQFDQQDNSTQMMDNIEKQMHIYIDEFVDTMNSWLDASFFQQFVTVS